LFKPGKIHFDQFVMLQGTRFMSTITLQPQLMEQLEKVASEQAVELDELLENAVRAYLRRLEREKIRAEATAFQEMHARLTKTHLGQYVAIHINKIVDNDTDFQALHRRVRQRFGSRPVLLRQV
jgi:metal-responsive CopG/Arc/MetJ family transcriptional regulator